MRHATRCPGLVAARTAGAPQGSQSQLVQGLDRPTVFDVGIALSTPDVGVTKRAAHEEKVAGRVAEQRGKRVT